jgi:glycosyltransferase involved in cell wall biosynthesis
MIKVGFDISQTAYVGGVSTYTQNLAEELQANSDLKMLFFYSSLRQKYQGPLQQVKSFKVPQSINQLLFHKTRLFPIEKFIGQIDIYHSSDWLQAPSKAKKVTTYHDVIPLKYPEWSVKEVVDVHRKRLSIVEGEIDMVIAVSEATKNDLLEVSRIPKEKIVVIHEGVGQQFTTQSLEDIERFKKKMNLPEHFVLAIGGVGIRRNLERVKKVVQQHLVITGETIPHVANDEMPLLYAGADVLLYPSFYEGFGLPVLESMACGTPVITSDLSATKEISGDAAMLIDPMSESQIKDAVEQVLHNKKLHDELRKKGLLQVKKFTWKKCASETADLYRRLMQ